MIDPTVYFIPNLFNLVEGSEEDCSLKCPSVCTETHASEYKRAYYVNF